jgi:cytoskeletal protein CcmA (bactofilin family)
VALSAVLCYHCGGETSVAARAMSATCSRCHKSLDIGDVRIKGHHWGGVLCTCGSLWIGRKARVSVKVAVASLRADVLGKFEGILVSGGPVTLGSRCEFSGALWAPAVRLEEGARVRDARFVVPCDPLGQVEINGGRGALPDEPEARRVG